MTDTKHAPQQTAGSIALDSISNRRNSYTKDAKVTKTELRFWILGALCGLGVNHQRIGTRRFVLVPAS